MEQGIIKFWNNEKGFGFIEVKNFNSDYFFHVSEIINEDYQPEIGDCV